MTDQASKGKWNAYEYVTQRLLMELESGKCPWQSPYLASGEHRSLATGQSYNGINTLLLTMEAIARGFASPWWSTLRAANKLGGSVRRGEHGAKVFFFKPVVTKEKDTEAEEEEKHRRLVLRAYTVFNIEQLDGIVAPAAQPHAVDVEPHAAAEAMWASYAANGGPARKEHRAGPAFYRRVDDVVSLPEPGLVTSTEEYYLMLFHEGVHSTGHESRLSRAGIRKDDYAPFGSPTYSQEELVAEMGAAMLAYRAGLELPWSNSAAYLRGWYEKLRQDKRCAVFAAKQAEKAARWILGERAFKQPNAPNAEDFTEVAA
ncbi:MAG: hypothetical protein QOE90_3039 [Thermoplasmata archaeon]|nr:hypothetical protein [Thermoplasmata archaeon]